MTARRTWYSTRAWEKSSVNYKKMDLPGGRSIPRYVTLCTDHMWLERGQDLFSSLVTLRAKSLRKKLLKTLQFRLAHLFGGFQPRGRHGL